MTETKCLSKGDILKSKDIKIERVEVPEWGGHTFVKVMSGIERENYEDSIFEVSKEGTKRKPGSVRAKLVAKTMCDEKGKLLFNELEIRDLEKKSGKALDRVFDCAKIINGIGADTVKENAKN